MKKVVILSLLALFFSLKTSAQEIQEYTNPYQLISAVAQKARENDTIKTNRLIFNRTYTIWELDQSDKPKSKRPNLKEEILQGKGHDNEPLKLDMNLVLESSYFLGFDPNKIQILNGEEVYVVHFWPKDKFADDDSPYYKAAKRADGIMYINKEYLYVAKLEATMQEPFNIYLILGRLRAVRFTFEQRMRSDLNNIVVIDYFTVIARYRKAFSEKNESHTYTYSDYKLAP